MSQLRKISLYPFFVTILLFVFFFHSSAIAQIKGIDNHMLRTIEKYRTPKQNTFFKFVSKINNPVCLTGPAALFVTGALQPNTILRKKALFGIETIATAQIITFSLKFTISRRRPHLFDTTFTAVVPAHNAAFPSGHTAEAFAMATAMSIAVPKWYVIVPAFAWASIMAYARIYLGVHYPSDVVAGAIVGAGSGYLMYKLNNWLQKIDKGHHPANEVTGLFVGLGTSYLLYHMNHLIQMGKKRRPMRTPVF